MPKVRRQPSRPVSAAIYGAIRGAVTALGALDMGHTLNVARTAGRSFGNARFNRKRLARATDNLAIAFPDWTPERRHECALRAYEHLFMLGIEMILTPRLLTSEGWAGRVNLRHIQPLVRVVTGGRPVIFICGHCGNWEMAGYSLSLLGFTLHALYRPLDLKPLDTWLRASRARSGLKLIDKFGAMQSVPDIIAAGHPLGFVADQNAGDRGLHVPFFGRLASSYKAIGLLATRYQASVVVGAAHRLGNTRVAGVGDLPSEPEGLHYEIRSVDTFGPEEYMAQPDPAFYIAARYRKAIESTVIAHPEQYLWMHRYWKSRPRFEREGKPFPRSLDRKLRELPWMTDAEMERIRRHSEEDTRAYQAEHPGKAAAAPSEPVEDDTM